MDVILLEKVQKLGNLGETVHVKPGFARNFLIPKGKALPATEANRAAFEERRAELIAREQDTLARAEARRGQLSELGAVVVVAQAGSEGKLFGSVGSAEIARVITDAGVQIDRREVRLDHGVLRQVGEHEVTLHLHPEVDVLVNISIVPAE
jgi:large subunit ribosomal protein L9